MNTVSGGSLHSQLLVSHLQCPVLLKNGRLGSIVSWEEWLLQTPAFVQRS